MFAKLIFSYFILVLYIIPFLFLIFFIFQENELTLVEKKENCKHTRIEGLEM